MGGGVSQKSSLNHGLLQYILPRAFFKGSQVKKNCWVPVQCDSNPNARLITTFWGISGFLYPYIFRKRQWRQIFKKPTFLAGMCATKTEDKREEMLALNKETWRFASKLINYQGFASKASQLTPVSSSQQQLHLTHRFDVNGPDQMRKTGYRRSCYGKESFQERHCTSYSGEKSPPIRK